MSLPSAILQPPDEKQPAGLGRVRPRVMVVDDDPVISCVLAQTLNRGGYDVSVYSDGVLALQAFDPLETDLVVVDWIMPGLDGLSLIEAIKDKSPGFPALLISSFSDREEVRLACESGQVDAVLSKPFDMRNFLQTVYSFLGRPGRHCPQIGNSAAIRSTNSPALHSSPPDLISSVDSWRAMFSRGSHFERILESLVDAVIIVNREGRLTYFNRGAKRIFGLTRATENLLLADLCPLDSQVPDRLAGYFQPHPPVEAQDEGFFRRLNGDEFFAFFSISLFEPGYQEPAVILLLKDVSSHHHIPDKLLPEQAQDLALMAITDPLTGLYNRRHFDRRLAEEFRRVERYSSPLTLIMIDFDHFKMVNDLFGHLIGDQVLCIAAQELAQGLRDVDVLVRWGGEEFMVLLPETGTKTGLSVARRLHVTIGQSRRWSDLAPELAVTVSIGVVSVPWSNRSTNIHCILETLDRALYQAKETGRNRIVRYVPETDSFVRI